MTPLVELIAGRCSGARLSDAEWRELLAVADRTLCSPLLTLGREIPEWVLAEARARMKKVRQRRSRIIETYQDAARALEQADVAFVVLKGFTHEADAGVDFALRVQGDIDLLCARADLVRAQQALAASGFQAHGSAELSDNHVRPMLKPHTWQWRGDYFDAEMPVPVELHHSIWNARRDRIATPGVEEFWDRRGRVDVEGLGVPALDEADRLAGAALHLLRHVLRGSMRPGHAWELSKMLQRRAADDAFWSRWQALHPEALRVIEVTAFRLAVEWFGGSTRAEWGVLPDKVERWLQASAWAPVAHLTEPNKDALGLHVALLPRLVDRIAVARRRLLPLRLPGADEVEGSYVGHMVRRGSHHAVALARTLARSRPRAADSRTAHNSD